MTTKETPEPQNVDAIAVDSFAKAMNEKLAKKSAEGRAGWQQMTEEELSEMLLNHVKKGDPVDVANFCMMLWNNGQRITTKQPA